MDQPQPGSQVLMVPVHIAMTQNKVAQSCPTLCNHIDRSLPHSSVHGIFQSRVLEWVAIYFSRGPS